MSDGTTVSARDAWVLALVNKFPGSESLRGFLGRWLFYDSPGAEEEDVTSTFTCIRTYAFVTEEDGNAVVYFRNFHEEHPASGEPVQREQDGIWESVFVRPYSDAYFQGSMALTEQERQSGLPGCMFWRSIPIHADMVVRISPCLPPHPLSESSERMVGAGWGPAAMANAVWAFEAIFGDMRHRWSMGPLYSMQTLRLVSHFYIKEHGTTINPSQPIHFAEHRPDETPRPRLDSDVQKWMDGGQWKGTLTEAIWDEDGDYMQLRPRPAVWSPPSRQSHKLFLYPDAMYGLYPEVLPMVDETAEPTFSNSVRFEVGGMMRDREEFQRITLCYSVSGRAESIIWEVYRPDPHLGSSSDEIQ
ncbi:hypothetical protein WJX72_000997 [[Myrmecia] bisecta]|uniref:DUF3598 domain-containing protein n=1 Tax=[Myrmecia] bisecta TaxID=41462 RepID=A0AAW1PS38_9CHLO